MAGVLLRVGVYGWLAVLVLAALPRWELGPVRAVGDAARAATHAIGVVPGIGVMKGMGTGVVLVADCFDFHGTTDGGERLILYEPECPPRGMVLAHDAFEHMLQQRLRNTRAADVRAERPSRRDRRSPSVSEWQLGLFGDYFCHSPRVGPDSRRSVRMQRRLYQRHRESGDMETIVRDCVWTCDAGDLAWPRCVDRARIQ